MIASNDFLFGRVVKITAYRQTGTFGEFPAYFEQPPNGVEITDLDVQFTIEKSLEATPNTAEVIIMNAAEQTRAELARAPLRVIIEAGHNLTPRLLFTGDIRPGSGSKHDGANWETKLLLGDGSRAYANARVNRSYKAGTPVLNMVRDAARSLGLDLPRDFVPPPILVQQSAVGDSMYGWASEELTRLLAPYGYGWSIQNGQLQLITDESTRPEVERLINQDNGLVGIPELGPPDKSGKPPTLSFTTYVYPELVPGGKVRMDSRYVKGLFKLLKVRHKGSTAGQEWYTEVEARPL